MYSCHMVKALLLATSLLSMLIYQRRSVAMVRKMNCAWPVLIEVVFVRGFRWLERIYLARYLPISVGWELTIPCAQDRENIINQNLMTSLHVCFTFNFYIPILFGRISSRTHCLSSQILRFDEFPSLCLSKSCEEN